MLLLFNVTATDATGAGATITFTVPDTPSLVAVITALPTATAVTVPALDTVATVVFPLLNVIVRPPSVLPLASFNVTTAWVVCPVVRLALFNVTETDATGAGGAAVTVNVAEPEMPSLVAVITALPAATAVTEPELVTVATPVLLLANVIVRPLNVFPLASFSVTTAWVACPTVRLPLLSATVTAATGAGEGAVTVSVAVPETPSLVAVITAVPAPTDVT
jgi:hypothetical protein